MSVPFELPGLDHNSGQYPSVRWDILLEAQRNQLVVLHGSGYRPPPGRSYDQGLVALTAEPHGLQVAKGSIYFVKRIYIIEVVIMRQTAKLFMNGRSQAVRLPKEFRFDGSEVAIQQVGDAVVLTPLVNRWKAMFDQLDEMGLSDDFMADRDQPPAQERTAIEELFR